MASTADAWLILLLGMVRTREVFTVEQSTGAGHADFVSIMQDSQDHGSEGCEALSLSLCLPSKLSQGKSLGKQQDSLSLSLSYRKLAKRANKLDSQR